MKICKVKPSYSTCRMCLEIQEMYNVVENCIENCNKCKYNEDTYELVSIKAGMLYEDAFVQKDGKIKRVSLDRVYDIKEID